ncbi:MAG: hypothetical protein ACKVJU_11855 [Verrucomicrobiales bacterium]
MKALSFNIRIVAFTAAIAFAATAFSQEEEQGRPKKEDVEAFKNLSEEQKDKFKTFIKATMKEMPEMTREKRGEIIRAAMKKIANGEEPDFKIPPPKATEKIDLWPKVMPGPPPMVEGVERDTSNADSNLVAGDPVIRLGHVSTPQIEVFSRQIIKQTGRRLWFAPAVDSTF